LGAGINPGMALTPPNHHWTGIEPTTI